MSITPKLVFLSINLARKLTDEQVYQLIGRSPPRC
jgi:hypothetical protein